MERTFVMIKPDGVQRGLIGPIISRLEARGLRLAGMKFMMVGKDLAERHYAIHKGKPFYDGLIEYITSGPVVPMVWEGTGAIDLVRRTVGATNPATAEPGSIRGDFAVEIGRNLIHASDGPETAKFEIGLWFDDAELVSYERDADRWVYE